MKTKSLYIASHQPQAGSLIVCMGLMQLLKSRLHRVAFFRPIVEHKDDGDIAFMIKHFELEETAEQSYLFDVNEVENLLSLEGITYVTEAVLKHVKQLQKEYDFILIGGINQSISLVLENYDINLTLAKNLNAPYISVINGKNRLTNDIIDLIKADRELILKMGVTHFGTFINRVSHDVMEALHVKCPEQKGKALLQCMPEVQELDLPTIGEVMQHFNASLLFGYEAQLENVVYNSKIAAMQVEHFIEHVNDGDLIIVPGDRADVILAAVLANYSKDFATLSGVLLSGGITPSKGFLKLLHGLSQFNIPIFCVAPDTFESTMAIQNLKANIRPESDRKIALALGNVSDNINTEAILSKIDAGYSEITTPLMFRFTLFERAMQDKKHIVLVESDDERILRATEILLRRGIVNITLLGVAKEVQFNAQRLGIDIPKATILDPHTSPLMQQYVTQFYEMRKAKGLHLDAAKDSMERYSYFATMMVQNGDVDAMVSGAVHTTQDTIRPALQIIKTTPDTSIVSSLFFMCLDTKVLIYADCAINLDPTADELAQIAISSADSAIQFGIEPRIAMLSYSTGTSGKGADVEKVRTATQRVKALRPDLHVEGPIQYDAAIDLSVAAKKLPNSDIAGRANVFIFPDLNTGNNTYKAVQRSSGAVAIGPILQGLNKPVNDLSRGCTVTDIVNTIAITAIQAQGE
jgi:phosphate acetyltransferase